MLARYFPDNSAYEFEILEKKREYHFSQILKRGEPLQLSRKQFIASSTDFPVNVNVNDNDVNSSAQKSSPAIGVDGQGNFVIVWTDYRNGDPDIYGQRYNSAGVPQGNNLEINDDIDSSNAQYNPELVVFDNGSFVVVWEDYREGNSVIYRQLFNSNGDSVGPNLKVHDHADSRGQHHPAIAKNSNDNIVVVWQDDREGGMKIFAQKFNTEGSEIGTVLRVDSDDSVSPEQPAVDMDRNGGLVVVWRDFRYDSSGDIMRSYLGLIGPRRESKVNGDTNNSSQSNPDVVLDDNGNYVVVWEDYRNGDSDVYRQHFSSSDSLIGKNEIINDDRGDAIQSRPAIQINGNNNFIVLWEDTRDGDINIYGQSYDNNFNEIDSTNFPVNDDDGSAAQLKPAVSTGTGEKFTVVWEDTRNGFSEIFIQPYDSAGAPSGSNLKTHFNDKNSSSETIPRIGAGRIGNYYLVVWADSRNGDADIYGQLYDRNHVPFRSNFLINDINEDARLHHQGNPYVAVDVSGNFVVLWEDERNGRPDIYGQLYTNDGFRLHEENFRINYDTVADTRGSPAVGFYGSGNFIVVWAESLNGISYIYGQRFDSNRTKIGQQLTINIPGFGYGAAAPAVGVRSNGSFVATWQENLNGDLDIFARRFGIAEIATGSSFFVNDDSWGTMQRNPVIGTDAVGNFVIAWEDYRDGNPDIYAQRFNSGGGKLGAENIRVFNDSENTSQTSPAIGVDGSGNFVIAWEDSRKGDSDIYGQRFDSTGTPIGIVSRVNTDEGNSLQRRPALALVDSLVFYAWEDNRTPGLGFDIYARVDVVTSVHPDPEPPVIDPPMDAIGHAGKSYLVSVRIQGDIRAQTDSLHYRRGGDSAADFVAIPMANPEGDSLQATIPGGFIDERGIEYYISVRDAVGNVVTYPASDPENNPQIIRVESTNLTLSSPDSVYRMISFPIELAEKSPSNVFSEVNLGEYGTRWRLLRSINGSKEEYPNVSNLEPGKGYWLITKEARTIGIGQGMSVSTGENDIIHLEPGWNQIGNPFAFPVNWSEVIKKGNVANCLVGFGGTKNDITGYDYRRTVLQPFEGYFVYNHESTVVDLEVPPVKATGTSTASKSASIAPGISTLQSKEWIVQLTAQSDRFLDKDNYIGVLNGASAGWDSNDCSEAPLFDRYVSLHFSHDDWPQYPGRYTSDFRPINAEGHAWDFVITSNIEASEVVLTLKKAENLPPGWVAVLSDKTSRVAVDLLQDETYTYLPGAAESEREFRIAVGKPEFVEDSELQFPGIPKAFSLTHNYPNPFASETRFDYELPGNAQVEMVVYDIQGRRVTTLYRGPQSAGRYIQTWDGYAESGRPVGSGVYFLKMKVDNMVTIRKMVVMR